MWQVLHIASDIWCIRDLVFFIPFGVSSSFKPEKERESNISIKAKWRDKTYSILHPTMKGLK